MYPQTHFLFSYFIALVLAKFGVFDYKVAFFVALVALLVDIDHFIVFVLKFKDINLRNAWNKDVYGKYHGRTFIHHWIGFLLITGVVVALFFVDKNLFWILGLGYYSHMFLDYAHLNVLKIRGKIKIKEAGFILKLSKFEFLFDILLLIGVLLLII